MTGRESRSGPPASDASSSIGGVAGKVRSILADPVAANTFVVASIPIVAFGSIGFVVWRPLGVVGLISGLLLFPTIHRGLSEYLHTLVGAKRTTTGAKWKGISVIAGIAAVLSIPISQAFFANDLRAMATPTMTAVEADTIGVDTAIPSQLYGASPTWPSYGVCEVVQMYTAPQLAWPCYSTIGYARLWQMPTALPMMVSLLLLIVGFPLALYWHIRTRT